MSYPPAMMSADPAMVQPAIHMQPTVQVVTVGPGTGALAQQNQRDWSTGMCDCCSDCNSCCYSFFCWPCFMCSLASKLHECACGPCCCYSCFMVPMRTKVRTLYGITGSICEDLCCVNWCPCCAMTQMWRELEAHGV